MATSQLKNTTLVVFGKDFPTGRMLGREFDTIIADEIFRKKVEDLGSRFVELDSLVDPGSIYEATALLEELSLLTLPNNSRLSKSFTYKGYELWWINCDNLFNYFCLPYTQYRKLLEYLKRFDNITLFDSPFPSLFSVYLQSNNIRFSILIKPGIKSPSFLPLGIVIQIILTIINLPLLIICPKKVMVFTGDKFAKNADYDFRMKYIYEALRQKSIPFVEFIRSLESFKTVLRHAVFRSRLVIYPQAVIFLARFLNFISGNYKRAQREYGPHRFSSVVDSNKRFKMMVATQYLITAYEDVYAIRIMKFMLRIIGVRAAIFTAAMERNFHAVLGCKLNAIPTVGILHGVTSRYSAPYDFMPGFDGKKMLSVDIYGLWSEWWKEYYLKHSQAYKPEQLYVSGPMRPLETLKEPDIFAGTQDGLVRVLFVAEHTVAPSEAMPYLLGLLNSRDIQLTIKFRPYRDGFEEWLSQNEPQVLKLQHVKIVKGTMQEAIQHADVVVGSRSTGVLEALLQLRVPIFFCTKKWGDYYGMTESNEHRHFFAENPVELIEKIKDARVLPRGLITNMREQYFGDPYKNGSKWVVDKIEQIVNTKLDVSL